MWGDQSTNESDVSPQTSQTTKPPIPAAVEGFVLQIGNRRNNEVAKPAFRHDSREKAVKTITGKLAGHRCAPHASSRASVFHAFSARLPSGVAR